MEDKHNLIQQAATVLLAQERGVPHNLTREEVDALGKHLVDVDNFLARREEIAKDPVDVSAFHAARFGDVLTTDSDKQGTKHE